MTTHLTPIGEKLAIVIDQSFLDLLKLDGATPLEVTTDGQGLYIRPAAVNEQERFVASARRMMEIHADTFRKLAE